MESRMKQRILRLSLFLLASLTLCFQTLNADVIGKIPITTKGDADKTVEFTFPDGWFKNEEKNPFDLQYFSKSEQLTTAVFLYKKSDISSKYTARKLLDVHIKDLQSKRDKFEVLESERQIESDNMNIISIVYSGEKGVSRNYYKLSAIEQKKSSDAYLVVIQTIIPSQWDKRKTTLEDIIKSARVK